jgi:hypothetical protein
VHGDTITIDSMTYINGNKGLELILTTHTEYLRHSKVMMRTNTAGWGERMEYCKFGYDSTGKLNYIMQQANIAFSGNSLNFHHYVLSYNSLGIIFAVTAFDSVGNRVKRWEYFPAHINNDPNSLNENKKNLYLLQWKMLPNGIEFETTELPEPNKKIKYSTFYIDSGQIQIKQFASTNDEGISEIYRVKRISQMPGEQYVVEDIQYDHFPDKISMHNKIIAIWQNNAKQCNLYFYANGNLEQQVKETIIDLIK